MGCDLSTQNRDAMTAAVACYTDNVRVIARTVSSYSYVRRSAPDERTRGMSETETIVVLRPAYCRPRYVPRSSMAQRGARVRSSSPSWHQTKCAPFSVD